MPEPGNRITIGQPEREELMLTVLADMYRLEDAGRHRAVRRPDRRGRLRGPGGDLPTRRTCSTEPVKPRRGTS